MNPVSHLSRELGAGDPAIADRIEQLDWSSLTAHLDEAGFAVCGPLLTADECRALVALYDDGSRFRKRIVMGRHGYGNGEYQYFDYPLPSMVADIRRALYARLAPVANRWAEMLSEAARFPPTLEAFTAQCQAGGQRRATPLMLKYGAGDFNRLHQDLYGDIVFPFQVTLLLSAPGGEFDGGEFVLTEQRPRMQSKAEVVPLRRGEGVIFAVRHRPAKGRRGYHRVNLRHGVSRVRSGNRFTLGIIFHDAK